MAENTKTYRIVINGIEESVSQVEALKKALDALDERIKTLQSQTINVNTGGVTSSSDDGKRASELETEDKLLKQIQNTEEQIANARREDYQKLLEEKDTLKDIVSSAKERAAAERLSSGDYGNTMKGLKQELSDIKTVMQTTDLGDEKFQELTQRAGELTNKLKELETAYGQFGRNVGNYKSAAEGFSKYEIEVGGVVREFNSAKEAARTLTNELLNLPKGAAGAKELRAALQQVKSEIQDVGKSSSTMDGLLDTMESFTAIGQVTQGFSALFGFDNDEIERSIQKLVGLQNAMQGIEKINKQLNTQEGIGGWLAKGNSMIDSFAEKLVGAKKAQEGLNAADKAGKVASEGLAAAETAQAAATSTATVATKALSLALKTIGIGLIISAVATLITYWEDIYKWFTDTIPVLKNLSTWFNKIKAVAVGVGSVIGNYMIQPLATLAKVIKALIQGNFSDIPKIIGEGLKKTFDVVGNYQKGHNKESERQQQAHNKKMLKQQEEANEEWLKNEEAKNGKSLKLTKEYIEMQMNNINKQLANEKAGSDKYKELIKKRNELQRTLWSAEREERETRKSVIAGEKRTYDERKKKVESAERELTSLRIANMKEGLNKTIAQLEEERRQKLAKVRADGIMVGKLKLAIDTYYDNKILEAKKKNAEEIKKVYSELWRDIYDMQVENQKLQLELAENASENISVNVENVKDMNMKQNISSYGIQNREQLSPSTRESLGLLSEDGKETKEVEKLVSLYRQVQTALNEYQTLKSQSEYKIYDSLQKRKKLEEDLSNLEVKKGTLSEDAYNLEKEFLNKQIEDEERAIAAYKKQIDKALDSQKEAVDKSLEIYTEYDKELKKKYGDSYQPIANALAEQGYSENLGQLLEQRITAIDAYWNYRINAEKKGIDKVIEERKRLENLEYDKRVSETWSSTKDQEKKINESYEKGEISEKEKNDLIEKLWVENQTKLEKLEKQHNDNLVKIKKEGIDKIKALNAEYFNNSLQELRDFQTAISQQEGKTTVTNSWGIVSLKQTNENNRKLLDSYKKLAEQINKKRSEIQKSYDNGLIDRDVYEQSIRELGSFSADLGEKMDKVKEEMSLNAQIQKLASGINEWVQSIGGAVTSILSSIWDAQDAEYERYIEELDKSIDAAKKKYDEMDALAQEHADNMKSIEDDIASAQGDARDHLLDRYAAEIDAQRRAVAEKKKAEKEQEKLEKKKEKAEIEQRKREKQRDLIQAAINTAMSISMAAVNKWPVPAIPMMAMAAAVGAAQLAAISAQQYAKGGLLPNKDGGVIQGKSHREGGIKVLGGVAEVEGKEFITNKVTTEKNVELLEYINTKKRKIKLDDLIEFYGNDSQVKKNISTVRTKFADGGQLPFLRTDIDINDRLIQAMEDYSNRPQVVSVVEVIDKMQRVREVQTLAGIETTY